MSLSSEATVVVIAGQMQETHGRLEKESVLNLFIKSSLSRLAGKV